MVASVVWCDELGPGLARFGRSATPRAPLAMKVLGWGLAQFMQGHRATL